MDKCTNVCYSFNQCACTLFILHVGTVEAPNSIMAFHPYGGYICMHVRVSNKYTICCAHYSIGVLWLEMEETF